MSQHTLPTCTTLLQYKANLSRASEKNRNHVPHLGFSQLRREHEQLPPVLAGYAERRAAAGSDGIVAPALG